MWSKRTWGSGCAGYLAGLKISGRNHIPLYIGSLLPHVRFPKSALKAHWLGGGGLITALWLVFISAFGGCTIDVPDVAYGKPGSI
jgi:hypothetical protein